MARSGRRPTVSILLTASEGGRTFQRTVPIHFLRLGLGGIALLCLLGLLSLTLILRESRLRKEIEQARTRSADLERRLGQLDQFEKELARMEQLGDQVRALAGVPVTADSVQGNRQE